MTTRGGAFGMRHFLTLLETEQVLKRSGKKHKSTILFIKNRVVNARCSASSSSSSSSSVMDPYKTLRVQRDASESEVKKAFRNLALQYHPDVCKGSNCGVQFHLINEAYDIVMSDLKGESKTSDMYESCVEVDDEPFRGMDDSDWEFWEEWMGWEGASGIRDYSSHINPYI